MLISWRHKILPFRLFRLAREEIHKCGGIKKVSRPGIVTPVRSEMR